ncbi:MAG: hypothetical protein ACI4B3_10645 [Prevotella sp.]
MKKVFLVIVLVACYSIASFAQEDIDITSMTHDVSGMSEAEVQAGWSTSSTRSNSVVTNSFFSNWFVSAGLTGTAFYAYNEPDGVSKSPFKSFRNSLGLSVAVGKWFTPVLGLRTKLSGFWGKSQFTTTGSTNYKYLALHEQILCNVTNLFYGYDPNRLYNLIPYIGFGLNHNMSYDADIVGVSCGILNTFKLTDRINLNIDLNYNAQNKALAARKLSYKSYSLEFAISYNIGNSKWKKAPDVEAIREMYQMEIDAINAQLQDEQQENEVLRQQLQEKNE